MKFAATVLGTLCFGCSDRMSVSSTLSAVGEGSPQAPEAGTSSVGQLSLELRLSKRVPTVALVAWHPEPHLPGSDIVSARVRYRRTDTESEVVAPIDLNHDRKVSENGESTYETRVFGLKQDSTYSVVVEVQSAAGPFVSEAGIIRTGRLDPNVPTVEVTTIDDTSPAFTGFTVTCTGPLGGDPWAYIWDGDGDVVWAYSLLDLGLDACTRARMSYDGQTLWLGDLNLVGPAGSLLQIDLGGDQEPTRHSLPGRHHDFAILPNGNIVYFAREDASDESPGAKRDIVYEFSPESKKRTALYDQRTHFSELLGDASSHTNYISFVPHLQALSFSMLTTNTIGLVGYPSGNLLATFGGATSDFEMDWSKQHGHHLLPDRLLVFSNVGPDSKPVALEYELSLEQRRSAPLRQYQSAGAESSPTLGDIQRLPNGNTVVTYSNAGIVHELGLDFSLIRVTRTKPIGYPEHRNVLFGPPPPYSD